MPVIPQSEPRREIPVPRIESTFQNPDPYSHVANKAIELFGRIQEASDAAEARRIASEAAAGISGAIDIAHSEESDPDAFKGRSVKEVQGIYTNAIEGTRNARVRELVAAHLGDNLIKANTEITLKHRAKQVEGAQANSFRYLEGAQRELSQLTDPTEITQKRNEIGTHLKDMIDVGALKPLQAARQFQSVLEGDAFNRAFREVDVSDDPLKTISEVQRKNPNLDPTKIPELMRTADSRSREIERIREKAEKKVHEENLLGDTIDASSGAMTLDDLNARARARRYTPAEYNTMRNVMEQGGVTDPRVATELELQIAEGKLTDYRAIANNPNLDKGEKSRLMGKIREAKDEKHFSNAPGYKEAQRELRLAATRKGPMESLDPKEQQVLLAADKELYDRTGKGEDPMNVSRDIQRRITPATEADKPLFKPRYERPEDLVRDLKAGRITRDDAATQALLLKQWLEYTTRLQQRATQPQQPGTQSKRR